MTSLTLLSPAKLNLMLHITGRRADGYHLLQTVFHLLDFGDTLTFTATPAGSVDLQPQIPGVANRDNLVYRAASLLQEASGTSMGAHIELQKRLPMGGGLGGGSSNAATTLLALNQLWKTGFSIDQLAQLGTRLGADVPVFVRGFSAWGEGVGEQLQAIDIADTWYLILKPACAVSTAQIFSHKQLTRDTAAITIPAFFERGGHNDCEPVVRSLYPEVDSALNWLTQAVPDTTARLTGTGACVFANCADEASARKLLAEVPGEFQGFVAQGVQRSPVHTALAI